MALDCEAYAGKHLGKSVQVRYYRYRAAGSVWMVPESCFSRSARFALTSHPGGEDGTEWSYEPLLGQRSEEETRAARDELSVVHRGIVAAICLRPGDLTVQEFGFIYGMLGISEAEVAALLGESKSALRGWLKRTSGQIPGGKSAKTKLWLCLHFFARELADLEVKVGVILNSDRFLVAIREEFQRSDSVQMFEETMVYRIMRARNSKP